MIRIISGIYKGRKINVHAGKNVKATSDHVREAIFSILYSHINWEQQTALDLYAGSGSLGFEALSRGAKKVIFVEFDRKKIVTLKKNIRLISPEEKKVELIQNKALEWITNHLFHKIKCVVFIDPPFSSNEYDPIIKKLSELSSIKKGSFIVIQSTNRRRIICPKNMKFIKINRYGSVMLNILQKY